MKTLIKFAILIVLSFLNLKYYPILLIFPFPFFGLVSGFILVSIWIYLFLYFGIFLIFRFFKIDKPIKKTYLALAFPLFLALWIGVSFIPLEYQPSFRKFEELCATKSKEIVLDEDLRKKYIGKSPKIEQYYKPISWRIESVESVWSDYESKKVFLKHYSYIWKEISLFPKSINGKIYCSDIDKSKRGDK